jgi:hypothetical protein
LCLFLLTMVVGFTTTYAIGAYHHWFCGCCSRSSQGVQHYGIKFVSDLQQVCGVLWFPPRYNWNIVEIGIIKHITLVVIGPDCICSCKSNYHTTSTAPNRNWYFVGDKLYYEKAKDFWLGYEFPYKMPNMKNLFHLN